MGKVSYLPSQLDGTCATTSCSAQCSPVRIMMQDAMAWMYQFPSSLMLFIPMKATNRLGELYPSTANVRDCTIHAMLLAMEALMMCMVLPAFMLLPGSMFVALCSVCCATVWTMGLPLKGQRFVHSSVEIPSTVRAEGMESERWLFVNGYCASNNWLRATCDRLALTFGRPVTGIHNTTHGYIVDILEDILCRVTNNMGTCGRTCYDTMKKFCLDPKVNKVVIVAHSQGASITSMVLDRLCTDLPSNMLRKIEVYTFGSTACCFSNPAITSPSRPSKDRTNPSSPELTEPKRLISHIEHYTNERDAVSRAGILRCVAQSPRTKYCGRVFMRAGPGASGHLMNMHYLDTMFPMAGESDDQQRQTDQVAIEQTFLDEIITVEEDIAFRREAAAAGCVSEDAIGGGPAGRKSMNGLKINFVSAAKVAAESCKGRSVRELSRLSKYMGGGRPLADPDAIMNGVQANGQMMMGNQQMGSRKGEKI